MRYLFLLSVIMCLMSGCANATAWNSLKQKVHPSLPNPLTHTGSAIMAGNIGQAGTYYVMGMPWCGATALMLATVVLNRELKPKEAFAITASCVLPIIGGMLVDHYWKPEWDKLYKEKPQPTNTEITR